MYGGRHYVSVAGGVVVWTWGVRPKGEHRVTVSEGVGRYGPPCGHTDTCENITFQQLRLRAVITENFRHFLCNLSFVKFSDLRMIVSNVLFELECC